MEANVTVKGKIYSNTIMIQSLDFVMHKSMETIHTPEESKSVLQYKHDISMLKKENKNLRAYEEQYPNKTMEDYNEYRREISSRTTD